VTKFEAAISRLRDKTLCCVRHSNWSVYVNNQT